MRDYYRGRKNCMYDIHNHDINYAISQLEKMSNATGISTDYIDGYQDMLVKLTRQSLRDVFNA